MKGTKRRTSLDPPPPPPLPSTAEDGGCAIVGDKCAEAGKEDLSPVLESTVEDELKKTPVKSTANGDEAGQEEEEEDGEKRGNDDMDIEIEDGGADAGDEGPVVEPPKLAEGYYEIEAVRKKRTRKGKAEFLIKWRGWPESANTWEPMANLMVSVPDVITAFEERSMKRSRKNKRKNGNSLSQSKKKQFKPSPSPPVSSCIVVPDVQAMIIDETSSPAAPAPPAASQTETGAINEGVSNEVDIIDLEADEQSNEKLPVSGTEIETGVVTATPEKENVMDQFQDKSQLGRISGQAAVAKGTEVTVSAEAIQNGRNTGAKRRKSGPVRRIKPQDPNSCGVKDVEKAASNFHSGSPVNQCPQHFRDVTSSENSKNETCKAEIIEIIKPMNYTASVSGNTQEVRVTFTVKNADGQETTVDNIYLKAHNPVLLLNYYEQHLRYNTVG